MGRAPKLSLHERGQTKALSTTDYTVKQIADVVKRSRKLIMNFTALNNTISIKGIRRTCGIDASKTTVWRILDKCPNIVRSRMKKCPQLIQGHKDERLRFIRWSSISIYDSVRVCLRACYDSQKENISPSADDWLSHGIIVQHSDPVRAVLDGLVHEITQCVSSDIVDLPVELKVGWT
uniref:HTH_Tnp_Tc3_2 domain-containing protein n=1 Tax=Heterorhabditis bacteriophora TaxID=37862 RepID=A0A1I7XV36_HETBA